MTLILPDAVLRPAPLPVYGYICHGCLQKWGPGESPGKHRDPTNEQWACRDQTGEKSIPEAMGPVAERPWTRRSGPRGAENHYRYACAVQAGMRVPSVEEEDEYVRVGMAALHAALGD